VQFVIDPAVLGPPLDSDIAGWLQQIHELSALVEEQGIVATSAKLPRDQMVARWWSDWETQHGLAGFELARMAEEVSARIHGEAPSPQHPPLLDNVSLNPPYRENRIPDDGKKDLEVHFAEAACASRDGADQLGVLGPDQSWGDLGKHVLVQGEVLAREDPLEGLLEEEPDDMDLREFLRRSTIVHQIYSQCCERPCSLMKHLRLGVRAFWLVKFAGNPNDLEFTIGPNFEASLNAMNYPHLVANARKCLRVMALIAAGRGDELEGHEERTGKGGNNEVLRVNGDPVMRAYISNRTPNAHRLFWIRKDTPVLLNVTGHDGEPAI
jgi:hypothetical protein